MEILSATETLLEYHNILSGAETTICVDYVNNVNTLTKHASKYI